MDKSKNIEYVFSRWKASLKSRDRSAKNIKPNFEELFLDWKKVEASFDDLYEEWLPKAIKAHQPHPDVIRQTYKKLKLSVRNFQKTDKEFIESWHKSIEDTATETFFEIFKIPSLEEDNEPKAFGNMSEKEYRAQRRYAEQFPILDTTELEKRWHDSQYNLDIEDLFKNVLGKNEDETNT